MTNLKSSPASSKPSKFDPTDLSKSTPLFSLPEEVWLSVLSHACPFAGSVFLKVLENLIQNPNISSSHLFRAEIFYDSENDTTIIDSPNLNITLQDGVGSSEELFSPFTKNLRALYRPRGTRISHGFLWQRTLVRRLVPRNPQLDRDLVQTVHFLRRSQGQGTEESLVLQIPHVSNVEELPWYHPTVRSLAIIHVWQEIANESRDGFNDAGDAETQQRQPVVGEISIHYNFFPQQAQSSGETPLLTDRLVRTAYHLLSTIHKHGVGQLAGYTKRVHHDVIIPQAQFQDTYTRLKIKYAKALIGDWREQTDPGKHVFEDLGIAAFLIELWAQIYRPTTGGDQGDSLDAIDKPSFPGFVDVGCGNGVLVHILISEGYNGWGFDARRRKSWNMFPQSVQRNLKEMLLVPKILQKASELNGEGSLSTQRPGQIAFHDGVFPRGTFIVSNHADELTPWTPIIASLSQSPFIAIPCCSHNFAGAKFRAPLVTKSLDANKNATQEVQKELQNTIETNEKGKGHQSGSLKKPQLPSAYATLTDYVIHLAKMAGYVPEKEMLRIPSTRNACILGRKFADYTAVMQFEQREQRAEEIVQRELERSGQSLKEAGMEWVKRAMKLGGGAVKDFHEEV